MRYARAPFRVFPVSRVMLGAALLWSTVLVQTTRGDDPGLHREPMLVRSWRVEEGLPLSQIQTLAQTRDGYLWVGASHEGIYRFDGVRFAAPPSPPHSDKPFEKEEDLSALAAARDGALWVGTSGAGLWRLKDGRWTHFTKRDGLPDNAITALYEDVDNTLWIGTSGGLARIARDAIRADSVRGGPAGQPFSVIHRDRCGTVWAGTLTGKLYQLAEGRFALRPEGAALGPDALRALLEGRDGSLWVGPWDSGVARFGPRGFQVYGQAEGLPPSDVLALAEDRWGAIWIGTRRGLYRLCDTSHRSPGSVTRVARGSVFSLLRDREGTIWAGTIAGLQQYRDWRLRVYSEREGLPEHDVCSIFPTRSGDLLVGMTNGGVARFRGGEVVATYGMAEGLSSFDVTSVCERRDGTIWVGTWGEGLHRSRNGRFEAVAAIEPPGTGIIRSIYEDRRGDLWVGTWGTGLLRLHDGRFAAYTTRDGLADNHVRVIEEDDSGNLWIATHNGLSRLRGDRITSFTTRDGLSEDSIFALRAVPDGSLWIGTWGGGLVRMRAGRFCSYRAADGLPCDTICEILEDDADNLWLGTVKGITRVRKVDLDAFDRGAIPSIDAVTFGTAEGMNSAQCNRGTQPSGCRTADGCLWFATIDGMVMINPQSVPTNEQAPVAMVEQVTDGRQPLDYSGSLRLHSGPRELTFHYTATSLAAPEKVRFRYKLADYNVDWYEAGTSRAAHYTNIPPGSYQFLVKASNGDGVWGPTIAPLVLDIAPPFYQTAWFLSGAALASAALVVLAHRLRVARLRAHERELVELVERRTSEARAAQRDAEEANRAKDRFLAVLSHELRTPLTPVLLSVDCLIGEETKAESREHLKMIRRNIALEARLVDDLLDVSRIERGHLRLELERVDAHEAIGHALEACSSEIRNARLKVVRDLRARGHHAQADYTRIVQVFWNLISNAVKFTAPGGTLTIRSRDAAATPDQERTHLCIEFEDTGIGIRPQLLERIFEPFEQGADGARQRGGGLGLGLAISRWVAEAHGGRLTARSDGPGHGAVFRLELAASPEPDARAPEPPRDELRTPEPPSLEILLVEDNPDTARYLEFVLRRLGHHVTAVSCIETARVVASRSDPDLLISDIELPDGSGLHLMSELAGRSVPGIALSGYGSDEDVHQSRTAGFCAHLVKPVAIDALREAIGKAVFSSDRPTHLVSSRANGST
jgi:signal transduction histidine kinase/ligand-binding sensor domain-containing protein/CheY-like chemotaxis protein